MPDVTKVIGIGSHHGDDVAGWVVADRLRHRANLTAEVVLIRDAASMLDHLPGCDRLILIDSCISGDTPGAVKRLEWPGARLQTRWGTSTHGLSVCDALQLAEQLGRCPKEIVIFGIEAESFSRAVFFDAANAPQLAGVEALVVAELARTPDD